MGPCVITLLYCNRLKLIFKEWKRDAHTVTRANIPLDYPTVTGRWVAVREFLLFTVFGGEPGRRGRLLSTCLENCSSMTQAVSWSTMRSSPIISLTVSSIKGLRLLWRSEIHLSLLKSLMKYGSLLRLDAHKSLASTCLFLMKYRQMQSRTALSGFLRWLLPWAMFTIRVWNEQAPVIYPPAVVTTSVTHLACTHYQPIQIICQLHFIV